MIHSLNKITKRFSSKRRNSFCPKTDFVHTNKMYYFKGYHMRCTQSGKELTDSAWWFPSDFNTQYDPERPYYNGRKMNRHDVPKMFKNLKKFAKKFELRPFSHDYVAGAIRKTGINIFSLLGFEDIEVSSVR